MKSSSISRKTEVEIVTLREGGRRLAAILKEISALAKPGVSTAELDDYAGKLIRARGGEPVFKGYRIRETNIPYPASICTSLNDEVVHGIPRRDRILQEGDVLGLDIGMRWPEKELGDQNSELGGSQIRRSKFQAPSLVTDMAVTIGIGRISPEAERLIRITREALEVGIAAVRPGAHIGDLGYAIGAHIKAAGLGVIRDLAGHGVGYELHEEPLLPNYGKPGDGMELKPGMVLAIEPMATLGDWKVRLDKDEWTFRTADGSLAAHFEHTVAVTEYGAEVLTR